MPELPEVETIRRELEGKIVCKKIVNVEVRAKKIVKMNLKEFGGSLKGNQFTKIERIGKLLIFKLSSSNHTRSDLVWFLLVHLKMTGQLIYRYDIKTTRGEVTRTIAGGHNLPKNIGELPNKFTHLIFSFADKSHLFYNDMRQFGYMKIVDELEKDKILKNNFGIDAVDGQFTLAVFKKILEKKKGAMAKAVLLDQMSIAGIGNIYADEILFDSQILPNRKVNTLKTEEIKKVYQSTKKVLKHAIRHRGTTFGTQLEGHYVDTEGRHGNYLDFLKVYQREKEKCLRCKRGVIEKKNIAGRGTRFCPICQH
ncbi:MAG: bifunctional DNA-formamidopyrimidine glycosylase/DNA-(apurinic or apyrimidinic site) lyase [Candidatus Yanofskybacteria bacterium]|nr:bifunctional DNA-formamidopyrimidine glycosylase/DNA-(apurinic or apyrimidinic site) lyase [Candidatus Yanofskybacteria bacterium]